MEINYENETALMAFDYRKAVISLQRRIRQYQLPEDIKLLRFVQQSPETDMTINSDHPLADRFCYLIFDLISDEHVVASCKYCGRQYKETDLNVKETSKIQKTSQTKKLQRFLKREFNMKGKLKTQGFGTKQLLCPQQHILLCIRTWMS